VLLSSIPLAAQCPVLVAAASDLQPLSSSISDSFQRISGSSIAFTFGSSGMLAQQIRQGAPYHVFLSANERFVGDLARAGAVDPASVRVYAIGRLAVWSRDGKTRSLQDAAAPRIRHVAIANPAHAPYGQAAVEALKKAGLYDRVRDRLVMAENVRQALQFVESGNAEAGIIAWSLVIGRGGVLVPQELHSPIRQSAAATKGASAAARRFLEFLGSEKGLALLEAGGFGRPR
jgi:molybdate transport system substrate-binding protein